jgi:hypothetical protein
MVRRLAGHSHTVHALQTIKLARQTLEKCARHFTLLHLNLERAVIAYYLFIGRIADVETKMCKLYLQIQQVPPPSPAPLTASS